MNASLWFIIAPLVAYVPMLLVETFIAFRRIGKPLDKDGGYLHATWEATHTFLVLSLTYFTWLYSSAVIETAKAIFIPLMTLGAIFALRGALYIYLFYTKKFTRPNLAVDWLFALTHIVMIGALAWIAIATANVLLAGNYTPNSHLIPMLAPGMVFVLPLMIVPIYFLYRTKK